MTTKEQAAEWAISKEAQEIANHYELNGRTFLGQQTIFQAHISGQNIGFAKGYLKALEDVREFVDSKVESDLDRYSAQIMQKFLEERGK